MPGAENQLAQLSPYTLGQADARVQEIEKTDPAFAEQAKAWQAAGVVIVTGGVIYVVSPIGAAVVEAGAVASFGEGIRGATGGLPVPKNLPKNIHPGQQGKHIPGHNNFTPGRSPLAEGVNPQKLLDGVQSGAHPIVRMTPRGQPVVDFGKTIGQFEGKGTQFGLIHHGKKGAHIVPANPVQF